MKKRNFLTLILLAAIFAASVAIAGCDFGAVYSVRVESGTFSGSTRTFQNLESGFTASITAADAPSDGMKFKGWYSGGKLVSEKNPYVFRVTGNTVLTAEYRDKFSYTVSASDGAYFVYDNKRFEQLEELSEDTVVDLCFKPESGKQLDFWIFNDGTSEPKNIDASDGKYDEEGVFVFPLSVNGNGDYSPVSSNLYTVNLENGKFTSGEFTGAVSGTFRRGDKVGVQFDLIPKERYRFIGWKNAEGKTVSDRISTLLTVSGSDTLTAEYVALYSVDIITVAADGIETHSQRYYEPDSSVQRLLSVESKINRIEGADGADVSTDEHGNQYVNIAGLSRDWIIKVYLKN